MRDGGWLLRAPRSRREVKDVNWQEVAARVEAIAGMVGDDEVAHSAEDELWHDVLMAIANGDDEPQKLAAEALHTRDFDFHRWCA